ncbi:trypsin-like peptidase domain-containing protein [bacterium]|nr:MAG: trypsin-like peptidase domain-containing protein [bacterium]
MRSYLIFILTTFALVSCADKIYKVAYPTLADGKYDSEFPYKDCSKQLSEIVETVKMINATAFYKTYTFSEKSQIGIRDINESVLKEKSIQITYPHSFVVGTATVIYYQDVRVALLTCAHIIDFPDTMISYYSKDDNGHGFIQSISFKDRQINFIKDLPEGGELEILAIDNAQDIAILGRKFDHRPESAIPVFTYPIGKSKDLNWGTFIYIVGYPMGFKMITKGTVSSPNRDKRGSFLTDASFNRGFSGGIILAIRDGVPNFELVGMAKSVPANSTYVLTPNKEFEVSEYSPSIPYQGEMYVELKTDLKYGITNSISTESISDLIKKNRQTFIDRGYDIEKLFP